MPRAFILSVLYSFSASALLYFLLEYLCRSFAPFLREYVFIVSILISVSLFYLSAVHFCTFSAELKDEKLIIKRGFFIKRKTVLRLRFVTSVKNIRTPVMRLLKLSNTLLLSEGSGCLLLLIKAEDAKTLYNEIIKISERK